MTRRDVSHSRWNALVTAAPGIVGSARVAHRKNAPMAIDAKGLVSTEFQASHLRARGSLPAWTC